MKPKLTTDRQALPSQDGRVNSSGNSTPIFEENRISPEMVAVYRAMSPADRLQVGFGMWRAGRKLVAAGVRHRHPEWSEVEINREIARRMSHGLA